MDSEDVGDGTFEVVSVEAGDEDFAFLVEDEDSRDHGEGSRLRARERGMGDR